MSVDLSPLVTALPNSLAQWLISFAPVIGVVAGLILMFAVASRFLGFLGRANSAGGRGR